MQVKFIHEAFCRLRPGIILSALHGKVKQEKRLQVPPPRRAHLPPGHLRGGRGQALLSSLDAPCDVSAAPRAVRVPARALAPAPACPRAPIFSDFCVPKP